MWQTKYASVIPKNLGVGVNFRPCSEGNFLTGRPLFVSQQCKSREDIAMKPYFVNIDSPVGTKAGAGADTKNKDSNFDL